MMNKKLVAFATAFTLGTGAFAVSASAAESHTIQSGETLWSISQKYNTTVENLKVANSLNSDLIYAGEVLNISGKSVPGTTGFYTIQKGDTLFKIAVAHNTSVANLKAWNGLSSDTIYAGDSISVSASTASYTAPAVAAKKQVVVAQQPAAPAQQQAAQQQQQAAPAQQQPAPAQQQPAQQQQQAAPAQQQPAQQQAVQTQQPVANTQQQAASQATETASRTLTMVATAYTANCSGCSGLTANGTDLRANPNAKVIAVDPNVIPLGSRVWVEGYGEAIAADTGGAINGNKIDVFVSSQQGALNWGRRTVTVKILN